jgi:hypothetical protein
MIRCLTPLLMLLIAARVEAASVTLVWNPSNEPDLSGYHVGYRTSPTGNETVVDVGNVTQWTFTATPTANTIYYFRVFAQNKSGRRSPPSNEVSIAFTGTDPPPPPVPQGPPVVARAAPVTTTIQINFQPATAPVPPGYLVDAGLVYADRGNGRTYGWNTDNTGQARDREARPDQRYDTLNQQQRPANPDAIWELALPNGTYRVRVVAGDPSYTDSVYRLTVEGVVVVDGTPTAAALWIEGTATVTVTDGRLTLRSAPGGVNTKVCFVEIAPQ